MEMRFASVSVENGSSVPIDVDRGQANRTRRPDNLALRHWLRGIFAGAIVFLGRPMRLLRFTHVRRIRRTVQMGGCVCGVVMCVGVDALAQPCPTQLDDRWVVTVNGQTVRVNSDGSFRLPNISAADAFGPLGPGSPADFKSDDWLQVVGTATIDGVTCYASGPLFQIESQTDGTSVTFPVESLIISTDPPPSIWESIRIETVDGNNTLFVDGVGGPSEVQLEVWAVLSDGSELKQLPGADGTIYRTSNPAVANVLEVNGVVKVMATGFGTAYITVSNSGVTGVRGFVVTVPCLPTTLMGFVQLQDATPVVGATVSTDGGSGVTVANPAGQFSFDVCYTPTTPFSVVVENAGTKAVLQDVTPIPNGVTDVGVVTLEGQIVFWDVNGSSNWGSPAGNSSINWHTGSIPDATSRVFINMEDRTSNPVFPYTVTLPSSDVTVAAFTLDSLSGTLTTQGSGTTFTVTGASQVLDGKVEWRTATWLGNTLTNNDEMVFFGRCAFSNGLNVTNNGVMLIEYDNDQGELLIDGSPATRFEQASTANELRIDGKMRILEGATLVTLPGSKGITLGATGLLQIGDFGGQFPESFFEHQGGVLTLGNASPAPFGGNGLEVRFWGRCNIDGGNVQIDPSGSLDVIGGSMTLTSGTINNAGRLNVFSGTFAFLGGSIVGNGEDGQGVIIDNSSLTIDPAVTSPVKFTMMQSCNLAAPNGSLLTLASEQTIVVQDNSGTAAFVNVTPGSDNGLTNNGTIVLDSLGGQLGSTLRMNNDGAIINNGSISVLPGTGGIRELDAKLLENYGTVTIAAPTAMRGSSGAAYRNRRLSRH